MTPFFKFDPEAQKIAFPAGSFEFDSFPTEIELALFLHPFCHNEDTCPEFATQNSWDFQFLPFLKELEEHLQQKPSHAERKVLQKSIKQLVLFINWRPPKVKRTLDRVSPGQWQVAIWLAAEAENICIPSDQESLSDRHPALFNLVAWYERSSHDSYCDYTVRQSIVTNWKRWFNSDPEVILDNMGYANPELTLHWLDKLPIECTQEGEARSFVDAVRKQPHLFKNLPRLSPGVLSLLGDVEGQSLENATRYGIGGAISHARNDRLSHTNQALLLDIERIDRESDSRILDGEQQYLAELASDTFGMYRLLRMTGEYGAIVSLDELYHRNKELFAWFERTPSYDTIIDIHQRALLLLTTKRSRISDSSEIAIPDSPRPLSLTEFQSLACAFQFVPDEADILRLMDKLKDHIMMCGKSTFFIKNRANSPAFVEGLSFFPIVPIPDSLVEAKRDRLGYAWIRYDGYGTISTWGEKICLDAIYPKEFFEQLPVHGSSLSEEDREGLILQCEATVRRIVGLIS